MFCKSTHRLVKLGNNVLKSGTAASLNVDAFRTSACLNWNDFFLGRDFLCASLRDGFDDPAQISVRVFLVNCFPRNCNDVLPVKLGRLSFALDEVLEQQ